MIKKILGFNLLILSSPLWAGTMGDIISSSAPNWSGSYLGINLGDIWSQSSGFVTTAALSNPSNSQAFNANSNAFIGGGQLGYNWQFNQWVIGTEISANGMNLNKSHTLTANEIPADPAWDYSVGDIFSQTIDWQVAWVGRAGISLQRALFYGLGGVAWTQPTVKSSIVSVTQSGIVYPATSGFQSQVTVGGIVGAGTDYAVSDRFRLGVEYRYGFYSHQNYDLGMNAVGPVGVPYTLSPVTARMNLNTNQVVVRLNYQLNG